MGFFKGSQMLQQTSEYVHIRAMILEHSEHDESGKNYKIILLVTLTSVLTQKSKARKEGPHFVLLEGRGDRQFWKWLVH